jgi:hypothetical protein
VEDQKISCQNSAVAVRAAMKTSYCSGKNTNKFVDFCFLAPSNRNFSPAWQKNKELLCQEFELEQASSGRK